MNAMIDFISKKWVIQFLGLFLLALLIWFAGPWIGIRDGRVPLESVSARLLSIFAIFLFWGIWRLAKLAWGWHRDRALFRKINESDLDRASNRRDAAEKVDALRGGFEAAVKRLQDRNVKDKVGGLYELPWYVIIGAPGTGKTTALRHSGLEFPGNDKNPGPVKGVGGTRNCDWWFAKDAVFLDTAGRYVTQDSHQELDEKEWRGFLTLLKEYRPKQPLNGILVASSLTDLLTQTDEQNKRHADILRRRVMELHDVLGARVPIYMLFTKVDLVAGFNEFFADFGLQARKQVWGETFPIDAASESGNGLSAFDSAYDALLSQLEPLAFRGIQEKVDAQRRTLILRFPQQMALLKPSVQSFLEVVFASNPYEKTHLLLRGFYFACGTQEGTPIDKLMGIYADVFRLARRALPALSGAQGKSYFLTDLLKEVILPEAELAGVDPRIVRREKMLQWGRWAGGLAMILLMVGLWAVSYRLNREAIADTEDQIKFYRAADAMPLDSTRANFKLLQQKLDALLVARERWRNRGWLSHFGLHQGDKLGSAADDAYKRLLHDYLAPAIVVRLQERLPENDAKLLKAYRMFGRQDWNRFDAKTLEEVMSADWARLFNADEPVFDRLRIHLESLMQLKRDDAFEWKLSPVELDQNAQADAIKALTQVTPAQRCYDSFKNLRVDHSHDFKLVEHLSPYGQKVFVRGGVGDIADIAAIPSLFTAWGFREFVLMKSEVFVQECMTDGWVLNESSSSSDFSRLYEQFMVLYTAEYAEKWRALLKSIKPSSSQNLIQTAGFLDVLSRPDGSSPLRQLLVAVETNTALGTALAKTSTGEAAAKASLPQMGQARHLINASQTGVDIGLIRGRQIDQMEKSFEKLNLWVRGGSNQTVPLDGVLEKAKDLGNYFLKSSSIDQAQQNAIARAEGGGDVIDQAKTEFKRLPAPVAGWLLALADGGLVKTMSHAKGGLSEKAKSAGIAGSASACSAAFGNRYPFVRMASYDAPLSDFIRYFAPNGVIDQYFQQNLKGFVDTGGAIWKQKSSDGAALGLSQDAIRQFQSAAKIRDSFFQSGSQNLDVQFDLKLVELSPGVESFRFSNDGQEVVYRHGQMQISHIHWPGLALGHGVQFIFETSDQRQVQSPIKTGLWALLKMIEEASLQRQGGADRFSLSFQAEGLTARFELQASSMSNPFSLGDFRNFHCPDAL